MNDPVVYHLSDSGTPEIALMLRAVHIIGRYLTARSFERGIQRIHLLAGHQGIACPVKQQEGRILFSCFDAQGWAPLAHDLRPLGFVRAEIGCHHLFDIRRVLQVLKQCRKIGGGKAGNHRADRVALFGIFGGAQGRIEDYRELAPLQDQLDRIHFKGRREAFQAEHADELKRLRKATYLREKLSKKLGVSLPLDKTSAKKLKAQRQELTEENESRRPKLGQIRAELDQLSKLRYWTRKAIPDALPEREDFSEQMEVRENRRELEQVMDAAIEAVTQDSNKQPMAERTTLEKKRDQERQ